jgi:predicted lipoprotein with Yx(FWY)xxD motif
MRISLIVTLTAALVTSVAVAQTAPTKIGDSAKGKVLTSDSGMTLYVFDRDADGKSACNGACTGLWPPLAATASATATSDYTIVARDDGSKQWAYKKRPLYNWNNDQKPGDTLATASAAYGTSHSRNFSQR